MDDMTQTLSGWRREGHRAFSGWGGEVTEFCQDNRMRSQTLSVCGHRTSPGKVTDLVRVKGWGHRPDQVRSQICSGWDHRLVRGRGVRWKSLHWRAWRGKSVGRRKEGKQSGTTNECSPRTETDKGVQTVVYAVLLINAKKNQQRPNIIVQQKALGRYPKTDYGDENVN